MSKRFNQQKFPFDETTLKNIKTEPMEEPHSSTNSTFMYSK